MNMSNVRYRLGTAVREGAEATLLNLEQGSFFLSDIVDDAPPLIDIIGDWAVWRPLLATLASSSTAAKPIDETELVFLPPIPRPPKLICIGTNYHDHLREMGVATPPEFPYAFLRPNLCLAAHRECVTLPKWPEFVDWEAELAIVVGQRGRGFAGSRCVEAIAGYTIANDLSARDWIENRPWVGIDWVMQKAWDGFQPTGPWFTPREFVPEPQTLAIELLVNGITRQKSSTAEMIFGVEAIIEHLSRIMTLEIGDIIATGTPAGVGFGQTPRIRLAAGDRAEVRIEGLGSLASTFAAA
jgi:2-keto-4-pentenoate hydratase/2-oxohepta-3-ene-1,7-dioic acid hydratase in catechol pathway